MKNGISDIGDKRTFTMYDDEYTIHEVIENPGMTMAWTWDDSMCPHCKLPITKRVVHEFLRIEILGKSQIEKDKLTKNDLVFLGDSTDKMRLMLTAEKINEALAKSKEFRHLKDKK